MSVSWTDKQLDAINAEKRAIIVSAAAGSGKTAVLVEKLLRLLSDREKNISADKIAVVTFTNDAAAQMKQRLTAAIGKKLEDEPDNDWLIRQQTLIPSAKISTIHSFCFELIRENAGLAGIDPAFRIADAAEDELISRQAAKNVFDRWFENRSKDMTTLTDFFCPGSLGSDRLMSLIPFLSKNILALPFPNDYMDSITERYENPPAPENDSLIRIFSEHTAKCIRAALGYENDAIEAAEEAYGEDRRSVSKIEKNMNLLYAERDSIAVLDERLSVDPTAIFNCTSWISFERITFYKEAAKGGEQYDPDLLEGAKQSRAKCKKLITECADAFTPEDVANDYRIHARLCRVLFSLLKEIFAEEESIKREKNLLSFSDAEQLACRLLCSRREDGTIEKSPLAAALSDTFGIVMIDEFQDSTAVQELIFRMISKDGSADVPGTNFFAVGDVKQSIYRFRCADPRIFIKNTENSVIYTDNSDTSPARILLNKNFRSSHHVVSFVNAVFKCIMSAQCGGIDYGDEDSLIQGAELADDFGPTEIILLPDTDTEAEENEEFEAEDDEQTDQTEQSAPLDLAEARCVAARIKQMIDTLTIHDESGERPLRPSDFCILMRKKDKAALFIKCLEEQGVAASGDAKESYLESTEVAVLISLLRCIDNPTLDIPLATVLMSPMFMFTAEELARLRLKRSTNLYSDVLAAAAGENTLASASLAQKCREFSDVLAQLREYSASHSIRELITFIYDKTDYLSVISVYKDSSRKKANLRLLPFYAAQYDKNGTGCLNGFIRQIDRMLESSKDFEAASASAGEENAVQIKTIHKSKGLEYPFVFLCDCWKTFNLTDANDSCVFVSDYGTAFRINDAEKLKTYDSFPRRVLSILKKRSMRDEEMMLLYVALTRAKHKLFITRRTDAEAEKRRSNILDLVSPDCRKQDNATELGSSLADWLDIALHYQTEYGSKELVCMSKPEEWESVELPESRITADILEKTDDTAAAEYRRMTAQTYDLTLAKTAAKLSVSEIVKKEHTTKDNYIFTDSSNAPALPRGISAAAAGTAVHSFMQHADLKKMYENQDELSRLIEAEKLRLTDMGILSEAEAKCVREKMVKPFFATELSREMANADEIFREKKFLVKISDLNLDDEELMVYNGTEGMLQGVADCVFRRGDEYILIDYKTDRGVTEETLTLRYRMQLLIYAKALSLIFGKKISRGYIYSFSLGTAIELNF